ncbi:transcriptional regulator [Candidatus Desulfofervidus auxilii]|uniref:Transcriptional regulator n=1 Tax=Desulfofervidus auxilii TaxID=1621989 RepID=A0A7U4QM34_DESA2|nr:helix-turn-helix transcriptional regulator [Candidatus Desulfofervidus auxilii]AMM41854.1 transcriptional regulator [Candidatus Desulfofervidus auxilii]
MERIISNAEIGARIRLFRKQKNLTQMQLAERVGVSFQQIQKYEKGRDRIHVERLQQIARAMKIPISYFFTDFREVYAVQEKAPNYELIPKELQEILPLSKEEILVIKNLRVLSRKTKRCIFEILDSLCQKKT